MNKEEEGHHSPDRPNLHGDHGDRVFKHFYLNVTRVIF